MTDSGRKPTTTDAAAKNFKRLSGRDGTALRSQGSRLTPSTEPLATVSPGA
jgi:hypothetical protein